MHKYATVSLIVTSHTSLLFLNPLNPSPHFPFPQRFRRLFSFRLPPRGPISVLRVPDLPAATVRGDPSCLLDTLSLLDIWDIPASSFPAVPLATPSHSPLLVSLYLPDLLTLERVNTQPEKVLSLLTLLEI